MLTSAGESTFFFPSSRYQYVSFISPTYYNHGVPRDPPNKHLTWLLGHRRFYYPMGPVPSLGYYAVLEKGALAVYNQQYGSAPGFGGIIFG